MTIKAKEVLKNKFWLVEDDGQNIGTLSYDNEKYMLNDSKGHCHYFNNQTAISKKFDSKIIIYKVNYSSSPKRFLKDILSYDISIDTSSSNWKIK